MEFRGTQADAEVLEMVALLQELGRLSPARAQGVRDLLAAELTLARLDGDDGSVKKTHKKS